MTDAIRPFAGDFPPAEHDSWRDLAIAALKGAPLERIERRTLDGVARGPLFTADDLAEAGETGAPGAAPFIRGRLPARDVFLPWAMRQTCDAADPRAANAAILADLAGGASEMRLILPHGARLETLTAMLDGVMLDLAPIHLAPSPDGLHQAGLLLKLFEASSIDPVSLQGGLGLSPVGVAALQGVDPEPGRVAALAARALSDFPDLKAVTISADIAHEAGASEAQEIAFAAAEGACALSALIDAGLTVEAAARAIEFSVAINADIHLNIAKLRAARRVWSRILDAFGCAPEHRAMSLHAITSLRMLGARDPWPNLIRNACAGLAAAAGGADAITIRPATDALGGSTRFSRRIARNLHILLSEESHLGRAADPAGGGFLHETVAARLAETTWEIFQQIETRGGARSGEALDWLKTEIDAVAQKRLADLSAGRTTLIGVSQYADPEPLPMEFEARAPAPPAPEPDFPPFAPHRLAEPFEALWTEANTLAKKTGARPAAFLATLGKLSDFNARAGFAANRLAVGGIVCPAARAHDSLDACVSAFKQAGTPLAVICATDDAYAEHGADLIAALKSVGAKAVWIAGRPDEALPADHFIHARSDALDDLARAHAVLGVNS